MPRGRGRPRKVENNADRKRIVDYRGVHFRAFLRVNVESGDIVLIRNPVPHIGARWGSWRFKGNYD